MKTYFSIFALFLSIAASAQQFPTKSLPGLNNPWSKAQLMEPLKLAGLMNNPKAPMPLIFNIGVVEDIKGATNMGAASEKQNLELFKKVIAKLPKSSPIVVYCGCCPFDKCPNIRPAFNALKSGGFTKAKLLNLPTNIKTDWIAKGYPLAKK